MHCLISEAFSFMLNSDFHTNSTFWNSIFHTMDLMFHSVERKKLHTSSTQNALNMSYYDDRDSTQFPHLFYILVPHCYHTNSTFSLSSIQRKKEKIVELDFHGFSIVFPQFIHTINTLWNKLVFSSVWSEESCRVVSKNRLINCIIHSCFGYVHHYTIVFKFIVCFL